MKLKRLLSLLLAISVIMSIFVMPADALGKGSYGSLRDITSGRVSLSTSTQYQSYSFLDGVGARYREYSSSEGVAGPAACIELGVTTPPDGTILKVMEAYVSSPKTAGAFASGFPQTSVAEFLSLHQAANPQLSSLTEVEFSYATLLSVWASLGQLAVNGTPFTATRGKTITVKTSASGAQTYRVYTALKIILETANTWEQIPLDGLMVRTETDRAGSAHEVVSTNKSLQKIAEFGEQGIQLETINGVEYITRKYIVSSATSCYAHNNIIDVYMEQSYSNFNGTLKMFDMNNNPLATHVTWDIQMYSVPVTSESRPTGTNDNGCEYWGEFKLAIEADSVSSQSTGKISFAAYSQVRQTRIYRAVPIDTYGNQLTA